MVLGQVRIVTRSPARWIAQELDFHARMDPIEIVGKHPIKTDSQECGMGAGDFGQVLHDCSWFPFSVKITLDGMDVEGFFKDVVRLLCHKAVRWRQIG